MKYLKLMGKCSAGPSKNKFCQLDHKTAKISAVKHFLEKKPMLLNFIDLSTIFCPRL